MKMVGVTRCFLGQGITANFVSQFVLIFLFTSVALASSPDLSTFAVVSSPSEMVRSAVEKANALIAQKCNCQLYVKTDPIDGLDGPRDKVPVLSVSRGPAVQTPLFVIRDVNAIFLRDGLVRDLIEGLVVVDDVLIAQISAAVQTSDQLPDGFSVSGPLPGREFTMAGLQMMAAFEVDASDMLAFMLMHEVGHLQQMFDNQTPTPASRKQAEQTADEFASQALLEALGNAELARIASPIGQNVLVAGFYATGLRVKTSAEEIVDDSTDYEDWELRFFRTTTLLYSAFEGSQMSQTVDDMLEDVLNARGEGDGLTSGARGFLRMLEASLEMEDMVGDLNARLADPALFKIDPTRAELIMQRASLHFQQRNFKHARSDLQASLQIYDALGLRASRSGWNVLGALAVTEARLNNATAGKAYCRELDRLEIVGLGAPTDYMAEVDAICEGFYK